MSNDNIIDLNQFEFKGQSVLWGNTMGHDALFN